VDSSSTLAITEGDQLQPDFRPADEYSRSEQLEDIALNCFGQKLVKRFSLPIPGRDDCLLCCLDFTQPCLVDLYETRTASSKMVQRQGIERVITQYGLNELITSRGEIVPPVDVDAVLAHWKHHSPINPEPTTGWLRTRLESYEQWIDQRKIIFPILLLVARAPQGTITAEKIGRIVFPQVDVESGAQVKSAHRLLQQMIDRFLLFRVELRTPSGQRQTVYFLGVAGAHILERRGYQEGRRFSRTERREISEAPFFKATNMFNHNSALLDWWLDLSTRCTRREFQITEQDKVSVQARADDFFASQHLAMTYPVPGRINAQGGYSKPTWKGMIPDGIGLIRCENLSPESSSLPDAFALPLAVEWDTGSRKIRNVVPQLLAYLSASHVKNFSKRFPILPDTCDVPVLFITASAKDRRTATSHLARADTIVRRFQQAVVERGYRDRPPIFVTTRAEYEQYGLFAPVRDPWLSAAQKKKLNDRGTPVNPPLLFALLHASKRLIQSGIFTGDVQLALDRQGARQLMPREYKLVNQRGITPSELPDLRKENFFNSDEDGEEQ
jgi:hypothetical protein